MIEQYHHKLTNSFMLWFDHYLLSKGQAYTNYTGVSLEHYKDDRLDCDYLAYGSPHKQWVTDSCIDGAIVPSGITAGNTPTGEYDPSISGRSGIALDFENGRALVKTTNENYNLTADFAVKDFNLYFTN